MKLFVNKFFKPVLTACVMAAVVTSCIPVVSDSFGSVYADYEDPYDREGLYKQLLKDYKAHKAAYYKGVSNEEKEVVENLIDANIRANRWEYVTFFMDTDEYVRQRDISDYNNALAAFRRSLDLFDPVMTSDQIVELYQEAFCIYRLGEGADKFGAITSPSYDILAKKLEEWNEQKRQPKPQPKPQPKEVPNNTGIYKDVNTKAWYNNAINFVTDNKIMPPISDKEFAPTEPTSRAMFAEAIYNLAGKPDGQVSNFEDVKSDSKYSKAVGWAKENKIIAGVGNNTFAPNGKITREQLITMIYRYVKTTGKLQGTNGDLSQYKDADKVSGFAKEAMAWAIDNGIIKGDTKTTLDPKGTATRAQVAQIFMTLDKKLNN